MAEKQHETSTQPESSAGLKVANLRNRKQIQGAFRPGEDFSPAVAYISFIQGPVAFPGSAPHL